MTIKEFFDFITDPTVREENMDDYLEKAMTLACNRNDATEKEKVDEEVFKNSYIPHTMDDVIDIERDFRRAKLGESLIYTTLHGLKQDLSTPRLVPEILDENKEKLDDIAECERRDGNESDDSGEEDDDEEDEEDENEDEESGDERDNDGNTSIHNRPRDESPNSRKVRNGFI